MRIIFAVKDIKQGTFEPPVNASHRIELERALTEIINPPDGKLLHKFAKFPQDFELYEIGTFNESTGELIPEKKGKIFLINFSDMVMKPAPKKPEVT